MFEAECPSCHATYQMDERRVPPKGLKMRCPKCGESFQVNAPAASVAPVLGAALGLGASDAAPRRPPPPRRQATMLGVSNVPPAMPSSESSSSPRLNRTMIGVAPHDRGFELASLEEEKITSATDEDELDLFANDEPDGGMDLPTASPRSDTDSLDLSSPSSAELDLPTLGPGSDDEFDLPALNAHTDLPAPVEASLPDLSADLPDLSADFPDLGASLPKLGGNLPGLLGDLPELGGRHGATTMGVDEIDDLGMFESPTSSDLDDELEPSEGRGLVLSALPPAPKSSQREFTEDIFGKGPTHSPATLPPSRNPSKGRAGENFGEVSIRGADSGAADEFDAFPTETGPNSDYSAGSAEGYGDVSLDGDDGDISLGADVEREAAPHPKSSFPRGAPAAASAVVELPSSGGQKAKVKKDRRRTSGLSQGTRIVLVAAVVLAIGGGALSLVPDLGPYGAYFIIDQMNADKYEAQLSADIRSADKRLALDTADEADRAFSDLSLGRASAPRFKARTAYLAYLGYYHRLRFGGGSRISSQADVLMQELAEADPSTPYLDLANLAAKATTGRIEAVTAGGVRLINISREHAVLVGEAALQKGDTDLALSAWGAALKSKADPRSNFGMARALRLANKISEAENFIEATLAGNPRHAGARLLVAALHLKERDKDEEVVASLTPLSEGKGTSEGEQVEALILLGELHLERSRIKHAEAAFTAALKKESGNAVAQKGLARALLDSGRYSEALARFEASIQSDPGDIEANLGLVRCKLKLEQLDDAVKYLDSLIQKHPKSSAVAYWVGNGKESTGQKDEAIKAYETAIEHGEEGAELVLSYIALTRLLSQKGNIKEADEVIAQAEKRFPDDPTVFASLGELCISRGSYDEAVSHYDKALQLDPKNIGLKFSRGVALRQARRFKESSADFDAVEKESADYPGLALERGNLYEASGKTEEALKAYEVALAAAPKDLDLMLRVACGKASAGQFEPVLKLIDPVLDERGNSAEANFCKGLAILNGGKDANQAKLYFERAVSRDESRAKYHLYVGWVAIELQDFAKAGISLDRAIDIDRTLADAYWKRGELRVRQGAVVDALSDLDTALKLAPSRIEAHAFRARAMMQLGKEAEALNAWSRAVEAQAGDPSWNKDYGELLLANGRSAEARVQLQLAVDGAKNQSPEPPWLPTAHRLLAMAIGRHKDAVPHWEAFLKAKKGSNDPYLREALGELTAILNMAGY